jgi:hypothetical protein
MSTRRWTMLAAAGMTLALLSPVATPTAAADSECRTSRSSSPAAPRARRHRQGRQGLRGHLKPMLKGATVSTYG